MDPIPIVFIHRGYSEHLEWALRQAAASNPRARTFVISDHEYSVESPVQCVSLQRYMDIGAQFRAMYMHVTDDEYEYNLFCFQRWFVLLEFMTRFGFERVFYADSDVMVYSDLAQALSPFSECEMAFSQCHCGHVMFINSREVLERFCQHMITVFGKPLEEIMRFKEEIKIEQSGITGLVIPLNDMRLLYSFWTLRKYVIADLNMIFDSSTFDHNMNYPESGYAMQEGFKALTWRGKQPVVRHERLKKEILFHALHFQAGAKPLMQKYAQL